MNAFLSFVLVPLVLGLCLWLSPWLNRAMLPPPEPVEVPQLQPLAHASRDALLGAAETPVQPPRLEALMPAALISAINPPPPPPRSAQAQDRYRLMSVLLAPGGRSAVLNEQVVQEGARLDEYRVRRIAADRVVLQGPAGQEVLLLESLTAPGNLAAVARSAVAGKTSATPARVVSTTPAASRAPLPSSPPAAELERQFRHLLERLSP